MLTLKQINKEIHKTHPLIDLVKGEGYFYLTSDDEAMGLKVAGLYYASIYVCAVNHMTLEQWMGHVNHLLSALDAEAELDGKNFVVRIENNN